MASRCTSKFSNYLQKNVGGEVDFFACRYTSKVSSNWYYHFRCMWPGMPKLPKINKFVLSLQYLKREVSDEVDILHTDKHESFWYKDFWWGWSNIPQSFQNSKFAMSLEYLKKEVRDKVDFLHVEKHQSCLQVDFNILGIKVSYKAVLSLLMGIMKHSLSTQSNKFTLSLQYLEKIVNHKAF